MCRGGEQSIRQQVSRRETFPPAPAVSTLTLLNKHILDGWLAGWLDERINGWIDGWMDGIKDYRFFASRTFYQRKSKGGEGDMLLKTIIAC